MKSTMGDNSVPKFMTESLYSNPNQGISMVANQTDRIEILMERGNCVRLSAPVRMAEPGDFSAWSEKLMENLNRCPFPFSEMLETVPVATFCSLMEKAGEKVDDAHQWQYLDGQPVDPGLLAETETKKPADNIDQVFKSVRVEVSTRKVARVFVRLVFIIPIDVVQRYYKTPACYYLFLKVF